MRYEHEPIRTLVEAVQEQLATLVREGWSQEDQHHAERAFYTIIDGLDTGKFGGFKKGNPKKLRIRDIKEGDVYRENGRVLWTAVADVREAYNREAWTLRIRHPDHGRSLRMWDYNDGDFELPGLERPVR